MKSELANIVNAILRDVRIAQEMIGKKIEVVKYLSSGNEFSMFLSPPTIVLVVELSTT